MTNTSTSALKGWHVALGIFVLGVAGMIAVRGGVIHMESYYTYLPHYLGDAPFWQKIFDVKVTDAGNYQARELSYVFDWLDCHFIDLCVGLRLPHFLSFTYYLFSALTSVMVWRFGVYDLKLDRWIVALLLALFWTAPQVVLSGFCYRSAKVGTMLVSCAFVWLCHRQLAAPIPTKTMRERLQIWLGAYLLIVIGGLFDRQGFFLGAVATGILLFWFCAYRGTMALGLALATAAAVGTCHLYNKWLCPKIIHALLGYYPDFTFQGTSLSTRELINPQILSDSFFLLLDTARFCFGNGSRPQTGLMIGFVAAGLFFAAKRYPMYAPRFPRLGPWMIMTIFWGLWGALFLMNEFMVMKFSPVLWPDIRRIYYWSPTVGLFLMSAVLILGWIGRASLLNLRFARVLLVIFVICNVVEFPRHNHIFRTGHLAGWIQGRANLIRALYYLGEPRDGAENDPLYRLFWSRHLKKPLPPAPH